MLSFDVVEWGAPLQKIERETRQPRGTEVLVKVAYCGVRHSDARIRDGYFDLGGGDGRAADASKSCKPSLRARFMRRSILSAPK